MVLITNVIKLHVTIVGIDIKAVISSFPVNIIKEVQTVNLLVYGNPIRISKAPYKINKN